MTVGVSAVWLTEMSETRKGSLEWNNNTCGMVASDSEAAVEDAVYLVLRKPHTSNTLQKYLEFFSNVLFNS